MSDINGRDIDAELAEVRAALAHLDGVRALTRDTTTGYVREANTWEDAS